MASDFLRKLARPTALGALAGVLLAVATRALDGWLVAESTIGTGNARALLGAAFGSVVTVGAFSFWMRPIAAQLAASTVPPRLLAGHLYDRFQRRVIAASVGVLSFLAAVLLSLPEGSAEPAPLISVATGTLLGVGAIAALLVAMRHAETSTRPSVVLAEAAHDVIAHIRRTSLDGPTEHARAPAGTSSMAVVAPRSGWVRAIDHDGLLAAAPEGATVRIEADVGTFVVGGWTTVLTVLAAHDVGDRTRRRLAAQFDVGSERGSELDLVGTMTQFVDVGVHAASGSAASPSTVYETMWWLGAVLHELTRHYDVGFPDRSLDDGRTLVREQRLSTPDLAQLAVDRIRQVTADEPGMALELLRVVVDAADEASDAGRTELARTLREQADLIVEQCRRGPGLPSDIDRVVRARGGAPAGDEAPAARGEEYPTDEDGDDRGAAGEVAAHRA